MEPENQGSRFGEVYLNLDNLLYLSELCFLLSSEKLGDWTNNLWCLYQF